MGRKLFKQPNGLYGIYSTEVDQITCCNMKKEDYIDLRIKEVREELEEMFAKEETNPWKGTVHAHILDADIMFDEIFCYNWSEDDLIANIGMLMSAGYPKEKINELEDKWNESQKEREAEENGE